MPRRSTTPKRAKRTPTPSKRAIGTPISVAGSEKEPLDLDFDLGLETPGRDEGRRSSFYERGRDALDYASRKASTHIGFVLLVFSICSIVLSPFLNGVPKIVRVPVHQGPNDCPCNASKVDYFDSEILRLKTDLATAVRVSEEETKKAEDIIVLQHEAIEAVQSSIAKLTSKHDEVMLMTSEGDGGEGNLDENVAVGSVFNTIRGDMNKLKSQVQSLSDTHMMIQQFNNHAENLIARSKEIEMLIQAQNDSLMAHVTSECTLCDEKPAMPREECVNTEKGSDFVNLNMARQIVADEVSKECMKKIDEVKEIYDVKMSKLANECNEQCTRANAVASVEEEINIYNQRTNFASRKAGAIILHDFTSATWEPKGAPDLAKRAVIFIKSQESLWDKTARQLVDKKLTDLIDFTALESTLRRAAEAIGVTKKLSVGTPEDAISSDMSLGSCWPMADGMGQITIKLARPAILSGVSIDHIPSHAAIDIKSAPKEFQLYSLTDPTLPDSVGALLVEGSYSIENGVPSSQFFEFQSDKPVEFIRLEILSNYGHPDFACLYRVRIHGS